MRRLAALGTAAVIAAALFAGCGRRDRAADPRPNILLVTIDTFRADHLGAAGYPRATTPVLDALAAAGARFTQAISQAPETAPSHATMLTGLYPSEHGVRSNGVHALPGDVTTFAERARGAGYRTAAFVGSFVLDRRFGLAQGFDVYDDAMEARDVARAANAPGGGAPPAVWYGNIIEGAFERPASEVNAAAIRWLNANHDAPFFLWVHFYDPHAPYAPPRDADIFPKRDPTSSHAAWDAFEREHLAGAARGAPRDPDSAGAPALDPGAQRRLETLAEDLVALYDGEVRACDAQVGLLLDRLDALGLGDNTLVIVTSDHGESLAENGYYFRHGWYLYDNVLRVPLIVRFPGHVPAAQVVEEPVELVDLYATMCNAVPQLNEPDLHGDLVARAADAASRAPRDRTDEPDFTYSETFLRKQLVGGLPHFALREPNWKLVTALRDGSAVRRHLFDLARDPGETRDAAAQAPDVADRLEQQLQNFIARHENAARAEASRIEMDPATLEKLRALGYIN